MKNEAALSADLEKVQKELDLAHAETVLLKKRAERAKQHLDIKPPQIASAKAALDGYYDADL